LDVTESGGVTSRRLLVQRTSLIVRFADRRLLTAALLATTLFFTLALLTFALLSLFILLLAACCPGKGCARLVWWIVFVYP